MKKYVLGEKVFVNDNGKKRVGVISSTTYAWQLNDQYHYYHVTLEETRLTKAFYLYPVHSCYIIDSVRRVKIKNTKLGKVMYK
jgi:hypothetical protein